MTLGLSRRAIAAILALSLPLGACMETIGRPPYNHGPTDTQIGLCHLTDGPTTGAKCKPEPPPKNWGWFWWS